MAGAILVVSVDARDHHVQLRVVGLPPVIRVR